MEVEANGVVRVVDGGPVMGEDALEEEIAEGTYDATPKTCCGRVAPSALPASVEFSDCGGGEVSAVPCDREEDDVEGECARDCVSCDEEGSDSGSLVIVLIHTLTRLRGSEVAVGSCCSRRVDGVDVGSEVGVFDELRLGPRAFKSFFKAKTNGSFVSLAVFPSTSLHVVAAAVLVALLATAGLG